MTSSRIWVIAIGHKWFNRRNTKRKYVNVMEYWEINPETFDNLYIRSKLARAISIWMEKRKLGQADNICPSLKKERTLCEALGALTQNWKVLLDTRTTIWPTSTQSGKNVLCLEYLLPKIKITSRAVAAASLLNVHLWMTTLKYFNH